MFFRSRNANFIGWSGHLQSFHFLVSIGFKLEHQTVRRQQEEAENAPVGLNRAQSLGRVTCSSVGRISSQLNPLTPVKTCRKADSQNATATGTMKMHISTAFIKNQKNCLLRFTLPPINLEN